MAKKRVEIICLQSEGAQYVCVDMDAANADVLLHAHSTSRANRGATASFAGVGSFRLDKIDFIRVHDIEDEPAAERPENHAWDPATGEHVTFGGHEAQDAAKAQAWLDGCISRGAAAKAPEQVYEHPPLRIPYVTQSPMTNPTPLTATEDAMRDAVVTGIIKALNNRACAMPKLDGRYSPPAQALIDFANDLSLAYHARLNNEKHEPVQPPAGADPYYFPNIDPPPSPDLTADEVAAIIKERDRLTAEAAKAED